MKKALCSEKHHQKLFNAKSFYKIQQTLHLIFVQSIMCLYYYDNASINLITSWGTVAHKVKCVSTFTKPKQWKVNVAGDSKLICGLGVRVVMIYI